MMTRTDGQIEMTGLSAKDREDIMRACLDYVDGWYTGDAERMARALHPELVKRTIKWDPVQGWALQPISTCERMIKLTRRGGGSHVPVAQRVYDITVHDGFRHIACATALSPQYMDYMQLVNLDGRWVIIHILWEVREGVIAE